MATRFSRFREGRRSALRYSRHVSCREIIPPNVDANAALVQLESLCQELLREGPLVLFPLDDSAVWLSSRVPSKPSLVLAGPSLIESEMSLDKALQIEAARAAGFDVPKTSVCTSVTELRAAATEFPLMLKPAKAVREKWRTLDKRGIFNLRKFSGDGSRCF